MSNPFQSLHKLFAADSAGRVAEESLRFVLDEREVSLLQSSGILARSETSKSVVCSNCEEGHFAEVQYDAKGRPFISCPNETGGPCYLVEASTGLWRLDIPMLLGLVAEKLNIVASVREIVEGELWAIGVRRLSGGTPVAVFFSRTEDLPKLFPSIDTRPLGYPNTIIFTPSGGPATSGHFHVRAARLDDYIEMRTRGVGGNGDQFDELITVAFRKVALTYSPPS